MNMILRAFGYAIATLAAVTVANLLSLWAIMGIFWLTGLRDGAEGLVLVPAALLSPPLTLFILTVGWLVILKQQRSRRLRSRESIETKINH
jgi:hypothetical protein